MALISRRQYDHPVLGAAGGSGLHASIQTLYLLLGNDSLSRYVSYSGVANSALNAYVHNFGVSFSELNVAVYTGTYPNLILVADPVAAGYVIVGTPGNLKLSIDVTAPSSGGPHTFNLLISHELPASSTMAGAVSTGAQSFEGTKTFLAPLIGTDATDSSSSTTGAFKTAGGMGIAKALFVGTTLKTEGVATLGAVGGTTAARVNGLLRVNSSSLVTDANLHFRHNDSIETSYIGCNGSTSANLPSAVTNALSIVGFAGIQFSANNGSTLHGSCISGAWTLGALSVASGATIQSSSNIPLVVSSAASSSYIQNSYSSGTPGFKLGSTATQAYDFLNGAGTEIAFATTAGAWTLGTTALAAFHTIQGNGTDNILRINANAGRSACTWAVGNVIKGYVYISGGTNDIITGDAVGDFGIAVADSTKKFIVGPTTGGVSWASCTAGAWTLGATAVAHNHIIQSGADTGLNLVSAGTSNHAIMRFNHGATERYAIYAPGNETDLWFHSYQNANAAVGKVSNAGAWTWGAASNAPYQTYHTTNKNIFSAPTAATASSGAWYIGANLYAGSGAAPTRQSGTGGCAIIFDNSTSDTAATFLIQANQAADGATTAPDIIASATQAGAWTLGTTASDTGLHSLNTNRANDTFDIINAHSSSPYGTRLRFTGASPDNNTSYFLLATDSTTTRCIIYSDGDLQNHDNSYAGISDERLKQDIIPSTSQIDDFKAIKFKKYRFKSDVVANPDAGYHLGVIAQELQKTSPGLVTHDEETDTFAVQYSILYLKACVALQETIAKVEALEASQASLMARLAALEV